METVVTSQIFFQNSTTGIAFNSKKVLTKIHIFILFWHFNVFLLTKSCIKMHLQCTLCQSYITTNYVHYHPDWACHQNFGEFLFSFCFRLHCSYFKRLKLKSKKNNSFFCQTTEIWIMQLFCFKFLLFRYCLFRQWSTTKIYPTIMTSSSDC